MSEGLVAPPAIVVFGTPCPLHWITVSILVVVVQGKSPAHGLGYASIRLVQENVPLFVVGVPPLQVVLVIVKPDGSPCAAMDPRKK